MKFDQPKQSEHWYSQDGTSRHDADLRVARKEKLFPSVTSILQVKSKPALDAWKRQEAILASLTLPRLPGESEQDFAKRVIVDMDATSSSAAKIGTAIHDYAERITNGELIKAPDGYHEVCALLKEWIIDSLGEGVSEESMVSTEYGYAGRKDFSGMIQGKYGILDFKSQNVKPGTKPIFYPEHCYQLAAYAEGKDMSLVNVIISTNPLNPIIAVKEWSQEEAEKGWSIFKHLLAVWQLERGYDPRQTALEYAAFGDSGIGRMKVER
jgi:hypothetical protein